MQIDFPRRRPDVCTFFEGGWKTRRVADGLYKTPSVVGGVMSGRGVLFMVAAISMALIRFICAAVSFRSRLISSIIAVVELVVMALSAVSGISLRPVVLLLLPPTDLSS